jgi:hypothetical protein
MLGKILGVASLTDAISNVGATRRLMSDFAIILGLTVIGAIIAGALVVFGLYESHQVFMRYGMAADMAALSVGGIGALLLITLAATVKMKIKRVQLLPSGFPFTGLAGSTVLSIAHAFYRGYKDKHSL